MRHHSGLDPRRPSPASGHSRGKPSSTGLNRAAPGGGLRTGRANVRAPPALNVAISEERSHAELRDDTHGRDTCRFGISPLNEMCLSLRSLRAPSAYGSRVAETFLSMPESRDHRDTLLALVNDEFSTPDVINPRPESPSPRLAAEMRCVASAPASVLRHDLDRLWPCDVPRAVQGPSGVVMARVLEALEAYWTWAFAAFWARHRSVLEADVRYRASQSAGYGLMHALSELHPASRSTASRCAPAARWGRPTPRR